MFQNLWPPTLGSFSRVQLQNTRGVCEPGRLTPFKGMSVLRVFSPKMRSFRLLLLTIACAAPLFAQRGDKRGEEQKPLPEHIKVPPAPVRTPEEEAATFKLAPGFRAELIAA